MPRIVAAAQTDRGRVRPNNQDAVFTGAIQLPGGPSAQICILADGIGGAQSGALASKLACEALLNHLRQALASRLPNTATAWLELLQDGMCAANGQVYQAAHSASGQRGMGTTLIVALVVGDEAYLASVGDSRAYLLQPAPESALGAAATQLTTDHNVVARMVAVGQISHDEARNHPKRNMLYRSIGASATVAADTRRVTLQPDQALLLCSDGLTLHLYDTEIARIALEHPDPALACGKLIGLANQRGCKDNVSVVVARLRADA